MEMFEFFTEDSKIVEQQILLIDMGLLDEEDVTPIYNLREVVRNVLSKRDSMVDKTNTDNVEGGD